MKRHKHIHSLIIIMIRINNKCHIEHNQININSFIIAQNLLKLFKRFCIRVFICIDLIQFL